MQILIVSDNITRNQFYIDYPELDTPIHRDIVDLDLLEPAETVIDSKGNFQLIQVSRNTLESMVIKSEYAGHDPEKKNFTLNPEILLEGRILYKIIEKDSDVSLILLSNTQIDSFDEVNTVIMNDVRSGTLPCYLDKETQTLVVLLGAKVQLSEKVHHGQEAFTHRNTYKGVILARALAKFKQTDTPYVVINDPGELNDNALISLDLAYKKGLLVINDIESKFEPEFSPILNSIGVISMNAYIEILKAKLRDSDERATISNLIELNEQRQFTKADFRSRILNALNALYSESFTSEESTGLIFSPTFIGSKCDLSTFYYKWFSDPNSQSSEYLDIITELLDQGETIPISIMVYRSTYSTSSSPRLLFVVSNSHPEAYKFQKQVGTEGRVGFQDAEVIAELDAKLSVDTSKLDKNHIGFLPLLIELTKAGKKENSISGGESKYFIDGETAMATLVDLFSKSYTHYFPVTIEVATTQK